MSKHRVLDRLPISAWDYPRPLVYVPLPQALPFADDVFPAFIEIARTGVDFLHLPYGFADRMRNFAAQEFYNETGEKRHTHLIMLDSDHIHPPDIVQRLCKMVLDDPERWIVAGLNYKRCEPYSPCAFIEQDDGIYRLHDWDGSEPLDDISSVGFGAVMIAREVFELVEKPWFFHNFSGARNNPDFVYPGHDLDFCRRARMWGVKIAVDPALCSPHMTANTVTEKTYRKYIGMQKDIVIREFGATAEK